MSSAERPRWRTLSVRVVVGLLVVASLAGIGVHRARNARPALLTSGVGLTPRGWITGVGPDARRPYRPDSRVLDVPPDAPAQVLADRQRAWLTSGRIPGDGGLYSDMVRTALLDIHTMTLGDGAIIAGWPQSWRYVWPRDSSMVAVALAATGHVDDAVRALVFLQEQQPPDGVFQARYRPDGSGPPDNRGEQADGPGWALWATAQVLTHVAPARQDAVLSTLSPLIRRQTDAALRLTAGPQGLPAPAMDYWEITESSLTLGTAAPLLAGLRAAANLDERIGDRPRALQARIRATLLGDSIASTFGRQGYPRHLGENDPDAAVAFLLPPFTATSDPAVVAAWQGEMRDSRRPAGGFAPGTGWKNDGISWTPETSLFALAAARTGDRATALRILTWLDAHRTPAGSLPEKVLSNGEAAGPAPLTWTAAMVVLAVDALERSSPPRAARSPSPRPAPAPGWSS